MEECSNKVNWFFYWPVLWISCKFSKVAFFHYSQPLPLFCFCWVDFAWFDYTAHVSSVKLLLFPLHSILLTDLSQLVIIIATYRTHHHLHQKPWLHLFIIIITIHNAKSSAEDQQTELKSNQALLLLGMGMGTWQTLRQTRTFPLFSLLLLSLSWWSSLSSSSCLLMFCFVREKMKMYFLWMTVTSTSAEEVVVLRFAVRFKKMIMTIFITAAAVQEKGWERKKI